MTAAPVPAPTVDGYAGPRVIGIDLSLTCTGLALPPAWEGAAGTTLAIKKPSAQTAANGWSELRRLRWMRSRVLEEVQQFTGRSDWATPVLAVVEGLAYGTRSPHAMTRAGLFWLVVDALDAMPCVAVVVVQPKCRAKYATGKGNAGKDVVMREVARRFPDFAGGEDEADAIVLRAMGMDHLGRPLAVMPQTHRAALDAVDWPAVAA